ncbi:hypothetical protein TNCV_1115221 [Trichonephila clavipes]|nr:hypothetical protein TNCV_1115221 [Trichonephila clavipes]
MGNYHDEIQDLRMASAFKRGFIEDDEHVGRPTSRNSGNAVLVSECLRKDRRRTLAQIVEGTHFSKSAFEQSIRRKRPQFWQIDAWTPAHRSQLVKGTLSPKLALTCFHIPLFPRLHPLWVLPVPTNEKTFTAPAPVVSAVTTHKTFGPTDLTSSYSVCTLRVFGGIGHRTQILRSGIRCSNYQASYCPIRLVQCKMTATAGSDVVQSGRQISDYFFQHLWPYIGNNTANVVFQMVKRLWLIRIDQ